MTSEEKVKALAAWAIRNEERRSITVSLKREWLKAWEAGRQSAISSGLSADEAMSVVIAVQAERERSAKLIGKIKRVITWQIDEMTKTLIENVIAEHEAAQCSK